MDNDMQYEVGRKTQVEAGGYALIHFRYVSGTFI